MLSVGNELFRITVDMHHEDYQNAPRLVKLRVASRVVHAIRHSNLGIRFLLKDPQTKTYHDVGDKIASDKTRRTFFKINDYLKKNAAIATQGYPRQIPLN